MQQNYFRKGESGKRRILAKEHRPQVPRTASPPSDARHVLREILDIHTSSLHQSIQPYINPMQFAQARMQLRHAVDPIAYRKALQLLHLEETPEGASEFLQIFLQSIRLPAYSKALSALAASIDHPDYQASLLAFGHTLQQQKPPVNDDEPSELYQALRDSNALRGKLVSGDMRSIGKALGIRGLKTVPISADLSFAVRFKQGKDFQVDQKYAKGTQVKLKADGPKIKSEASADFQKHREMITFMLSSGLTAEAEHYFANPAKGWYMSAKLHLDGPGFSVDHRDQRNKGIGANLSFISLNLDVVGTYNHPNQPGILCEFVVTGKLSVTSDQLAKTFLDKLYDKALQKSAKALAARKLSEQFFKYSNNSILKTRAFRQSALPQKAKALQHIALDSTEQAARELRRYQNYNRQILQHLKTLNAGQARILEAMLHSSESELRQLNQVGAKRAKIILDMIQKGELKTPEDIQKVKGLKGKNLEKLLKSKNHPRFDLLKITEQKLQEELKEMDEAFKLLKEEKTLRAFEEEVLEDAAKNIRQKQNLLNRANKKLSAAKDRLNTLNKSVKTTVNQTMEKVFKKVGLSPSVMKKIGKVLLRTVPFINVALYAWDAYELIRVIVKNQNYVGVAGDNPLAAASPQKMSDPRIRELPEDVQREFIQQILRGADGVSFTEDQFERFERITRGIRPDEMVQLQSHLQPTAKPDTTQFLDQLEENISFVRTGKTPTMTKDTTTTKTLPETQTSTKTSALNVTQEDVLEEPLQELEVESAGGSEFEVERSDVEDKIIKVSYSNIPSQTKTLSGFKGRFLIKSPSIQIGSKVKVIFIGRYKGEKFIIKGIEGIVEKISEEKINLVFAFNYKFTFKNIDLYCRRQETIEVIKSINGKKLNYTY